MSPGGNAGAEINLHATVAKVELLKIYVVSRIINKGLLSTENRIVSQPAELPESWIDIFAIVKASVPKLEKKPTQETKYFLGYLGQDTDLPSEAILNREKQSLSRWDKAKWGELKFDWNQITPLLSHRDPALKRRAEKIDTVDGPKRKGVVFDKDETFCQYTNYMVDDKKWLPDTIEYKKSPVEANEWIVGNWGAKLKKFEGTVRYQVTVTYKNKVKDSPGRIIGKTEIVGKSEEQACKDLGITAEEYNKLKKMETVDNELLEFLDRLTNPPYEGLGKEEALNRFINYEGKERQACKKARIQVAEYRILKSNLRVEDCSQYGIKPHVHRISVRSRNPNNYVSCLQAYLGVPWIFGSAGSPNPTNHQTEIFQGFDCADFAVGGARAAGLTSTLYVTANALAGDGLTAPVIEEVLSAQMKGDDLSITNPKLKDPPEIEIFFGVGKSKVQVGDLVLFDWDADGKKFDHTAVLMGNKKGNIKTELDKNTLIMSATYNRECHDGKGIPQSGPLIETFEQMIGRHGEAWFKIKRWRRQPPEIHVLLSGFKPWANSQEKMKWNCTQIVVEKLHGKTIDTGIAVKGQKVRALISSLVLPVQWYDAADTLIQEIKNEKYNIVISLGMKPFSSLQNIDEQDLRIEMEPLAKNQNDSSLKDDRNVNPLGALSSRGHGIISDTTSSGKPSRNEVAHTREPKKVKDDGPEILNGIGTGNGLPYSDISDAINQRFQQAPIKTLTDPSGLGKVDYINTKGKIKDFAYVDDFEGSGDFICNQINYNLLYYSIQDQREDRFQHKIMAGFVHIPALDPTMYEKELVEAVEIIIKVCAKEYLKLYLSN